MSDIILKVPVLGNIADSMLIYRKEEDKICVYYKDSKKKFYNNYNIQKFPEDSSIGSLKNYFK